MQRSPVVYLLHNKFLFTTKKHYLYSEIKKPTIMKKIAKLKAHQEEHKLKKFGKKIVKIIPELKPYVRHRLFLAHSLGIIPENMYRATGIIDDAIIELYESDITPITSTVELKIKLFILVKKKLDQLFRKEAWHKKAISTDKILHQELNKLKEKFTFNADEDFVMNEELSDISYHQKDFTPQLFLYDDSAQNIINTFDLEYMDEKRKKVFTKLYNVLSLEASNVVDLHVFGKLSTNEIAQIKNTDEKSVRDIILQVKDTIHLVINQMENKE